MKTSIYMKRKQARKARRVKCDLRKEIVTLQKEMRGADIKFPYRDIGKVKVKELSGYYGHLKDIAMRALEV